MVQMDQKILDILEKIPKQILINCVSKMMVRKQKFPIIPGAIYEFDLNVVVATTIIAAAVVIVMNLIVDLLYAVLDPRVRI